MFEFPAALMKEGEPAEQFHIQEERRLFYVALTRAENRLTLTTLTEKKGKIPVFIEDILMEPAIKRRDVHQLSPKLAEISTTAKKESSVPGDFATFPCICRARKNFLAHRRLGSGASSSHCRTAHAQSFRGERLSELPAAIPFQPIVVA